MPRTIQKDDDWEDDGDDSEWTPDEDDSEWNPDEDEDDDHTVPCPHCGKPAYEGAEQWRGCLSMETMGPVCDADFTPIVSVVRSHSPLIEQDGQISGIRLSDTDSCVRT